MRTTRPQRTFSRKRGSDLCDRSTLSGGGHTSPRAPGVRWASPVLTPRQRDVATLLVATGLSYKQIAAELALSEGTIRKHTERIYRALGVHSRPELTVVLRAPHA